MADGEVDLSEAAFNELSRVCRGQVDSMCAYAPTKAELVAADDLYARLYERHMTVPDGLYPAVRYNATGSDVNVIRQAIPTEVDAWSKFRAAVARPIWGLSGGIDDVASFVARFACFIGGG
jgi:hypothetical protein